MFAPDPNDPPAPGASMPNPGPDHDLPAGSQGGGEDWLKQNERPVVVSLEAATEREWVTPWQVRKAAWMTRRIAEFREKVQRCVV